jgi:hypothetical protein
LGADQFNGSKSINRVVVYTLQDNYTSRWSRPTVRTFSLYGIKDFTVEGLARATLGDLGHGQATTRWSSAA